MTGVERLQRTGARVVRLVTRPRRIITRLTRLHAAVLRLSGGRIRRSRMLAGGERDPAWCLNLEADPRASVYVEGRSFAATAHRATGAEAERLWAAYAARLPAVEHFAAIAGREIPIIVLTPA